MYSTIAASVRWHDRPDCPISQRPRRSACPSAARAV